mmetsp:Transcript_96330/g.272401  ORF Transcript_96330/g.272401 Transcript_96330/m.272401 type:complete len:317 (+) Transcript_96330:1601-2551(+)
MSASSFNTLPTLASAHDLMPCNEQHVACAGIEAALTLWIFWATSANTNAASWLGNPGINNCSDMWSRSTETSDVGSCASPPANSISSSIEISATATRSLAEASMRRWALMSRGFPPFTPAAQAGSGRCSRDNDGALPAWRQTCKVPNAGPVPMDLTSCSPPNNSTQPSVQRISQAAVGSMARGNCTFTKPTSSGPRQSCMNNCAGEGPRRHCPVSGSTCHTAALEVVAVPKFPCDSYCIEDAPPARGNLETPSSTTWAENSCAWLNFKTACKFPSGWPRNRIRPKSTRTCRKPAPGKASGGLGCRCSELAPRPLDA